MLLFYKLRVLLKTLLAKVTLVIEFCRDCGAQQPVVWTAEDKLWVEVYGNQHDYVFAGVLCPSCFDKRAQKLGIYLRWVPVEITGVGTRHARGPLGIC